MAGGAAVLVQRAREHLDAGKAELALHFIEMAVVAEPQNREVRETELAVYDVLMDRTEGRIFDLLGWLEGRVMAAKAVLNG